MNTVSLLVTLLLATTSAGPLGEGDLAHDHRVASQHARVGLDLVRARVDRGDLDLASYVGGAVDLVPLEPEPLNPADEAEALGEFAVLETEGCEVVVRPLSIASEQDGRLHPWLHVESTGRYGDTERTLSVWLVPTPPDGGEPGLLSEPVYTVIDPEALGPVA